MKKRLLGLSLSPRMSDILFIKTSSLGDVIHHMPAVTDARRHRPQARIGWVVEEAFAPLVRLARAREKARVRPRQRARGSRRLLLRRASSCRSRAACDHAQSHAHRPGAWLCAEWSARFRARSLCPDEWHVPP